MPAGLIVTTLPLILTLASPTGILSKPPSLSEPVEIRILPVPATTVSSKVRTILALNKTPVTSSAGVEEERVGSSISPVTKLRVVASVMPA